MFLDNLVVAVKYFVEIAVELTILFIEITFNGHFVQRRYARLKGQNRKSMR